MRLRHIKNAESLVYDIKYLINEKQVDEESIKFLHEEKPLYIEIGMGKGDFIKAAAKKFPDINFIGIEKFASIIIKANKKINEEEYKNLRLMCIDAAYLPDFFKNIGGREVKVDKIILNFSDPWPKRKNEQRRLTSKTFLAVYRKILKEGGEIEFKTDNKEFFDYSLKSFTIDGWEVTDVNFDVHEIEQLKEKLIRENRTYEDYFETKLMTEYEKKFTKKGNKICFVKVKKQ